MIYGTAIYLRLVHSVPTANRRSLLRRIQIMTTMISFGFCCRAVIILLNVFVFPDMSERWWFDLGTSLFHHPSHNQPTNHAHPSLWQPISRRWSGSRCW
jgi:hypothetical protein